MEGDIEQKQNLLKEEILDKQYDQEKFIQFCMSKKSGGDDLSQWTYGELQEIIEEFKRANEGPSENQNPPEESKKENFNDDVQKNIEATKTKIEDKQTTNITIPCRKLEKTGLNDKPIQVVVKNFKIVEGKLLMQNYVNYEVETAAMEWIVRRRYSDFEWLRTVLAKFNPGQVVPPLPNKKIGNRRFEEDFLEKRMKFLQKFMDAVMINEIFKASEPLTAFLSVTDRNQFEAKMKELSSFQPSPYIEEMKTFSGNVVIASGEEDENEKYFTNISNYFRIHVEKLYECRKQVYHQTSG